MPEFKKERFSLINNFSKMLLVGRMGMEFRTLDMGWMMAIVPSGLNPLLELILADGLALSCQNQDNFLQEMSEFKLPVSRLVYSKPFAPSDLSLLPSQTHILYIQKNVNPRPILPCALENV